MRGGHGQGCGVKAACRCVLKQAWPGLHEPLFFLGNEAKAEKRAVAAWCRRRQSPGSVCRDEQLDTELSTRESMAIVQHCASLVLGRLRPGLFETSRIGMSFRGHLPHALQGPCTGMMSSHSNWVEQSDCQRRGNCRQRLEELS